VSLRNINSVDVWYLFSQVITYLLSLSVFMAGCCAVLCTVAKQELHKVALKSLEAYCQWCPCYTRAISERFRDASW